MFTTEMIQLFAVVLSRDSDRVTEALLREGVMQFIDISEVEGQTPDDLSSVKPKVSIADITDLRKRIEGFLYAGNIIPSTPKETHLANRRPVDIEKETNHIDLIAAERESIRERQKTIQQEILKLEDIQRQVERYGIGLADVTLSDKHSLISMQIGKVPLSKVDVLENELRDLPSLNITISRETDSSHQLLISMKRDSEQIHKILAKVGWTRIELPHELQSVKNDVAEGLSEKLKKLTEKQRNTQKKVHDLVQKEEKRLVEVWGNLRVNELIYQIQGNFKSSARTVIFTGWLPSTKKELLTRKIKESCGNRCYLEWSEPSNQTTHDDDIPVSLDNPKVLAPFQMLVRNFGVPKYGTIDPTPFVMPLYLSMFGLMFADVGQGFVLALLGLLGVHFLRNNEQKAGLRQLSWLIVWCGLSSTCFGILFGSYFGMALFKPLWFDYHNAIFGHGAEDSAARDVFSILKITIYFGIAVIFFGLLFNWINLIRAKKWMTLIFNKGGLLGGWIYAGGINIVFHMISQNFKSFPPGRTVFLLVGLPALLLFIKEPYHYFKHRDLLADKNSNIVFDFMKFIMEWLVELLEIFSGYLSNTLSFMRVAGLGIAHACLMVSFFTIAEMTSGIFSILILILGNMLVIGLEGLSAGIQALRLSYYEFFTKFFHGTGNLYAPISLSSRDK